MANVLLVAWPDEAAWVAIAAVVTACGTIALAAVGYVSIRANRALVKSAKDQADAVRDDADASRAVVEEMQRSRELGVRPVLVFQQHGTPLYGEQDSFMRVTIENCGSGPALGLQYYCYSAWQGGEAADWNRRWFSGGFVALGGGSRLEDTVYPSPASSTWMNSWMIGVEHAETCCAELIMCRDIFGNRFRFVRGRDEVDEYRPNVDKGAPPWTVGW